MSLAYIISCRTTPKSDTSEGKVCSSCKNRLIHPEVDWAGKLLSASYKD